MPLNTLMGASMRRYWVYLPALAALAPFTALAQPAAQNTQPGVAQTDTTKLAYVMVFVSDMKRSTAFYRDQVGLKLRFQSPGWTEFETGGAVLALHPAGPNNKAGTTELGITVPDLNAYYNTRTAAGAPFEGPPKPQPYGSPLTEMRDPDGALISVGGR